MTRWFYRFQGDFHACGPTTDPGLKTPDDVREALNLPASAEVWEAQKDYPEDLNTSYQQEYFRDL